MSNKSEATVLIKVKPGKEAELKTAVLALIKETLKEPGCELFKVFQNKEEPQEFILWEVFTRATDLQQHMEKPYTQEYFALDLVESTVAIQHLELS